MTTYATTPAKKTVRLERLLPGPIERVWAFLVEPEKRARWFAGGVLEPKVGGDRELIFQHANITDEKPPERFKGAAAGRVSHGKITRWEPPRALAFTWGEDGGSHVLWELTPKGDDVLFVITHSALPNRGEMVSVSGGWHAHTDILEALLRGAKPAPFWSNIEAVEKHYTAAYPQDAAD